MRRKDIMYIILEFTCWLILLIEHSVFHLELAFNFMIVVGIFSLVHLIKILLPYAITVIYEDC